MATMQKINTNLWFDKQAEEAANYYVSIFKNSKIGRISRYGKEGHEIHHMEEGTVLLVEFYLGDQLFTALNGGPAFKFSEAISLVINCDTQEEVDYYWEKLGEGGDEKAKMCGWLKDKFGLSWQVVPKILGDMMADSNAEKSSSAMKAMLQMKKIDIGTLEKAVNNKSLQET